MALSDEAQKLKTDLMWILAEYVGHSEKIQQELLDDLLDRMKETDGDSVFELIVGA